MRKTGVRKFPWKTLVSVRKHIKYCMIYTWFNFLYGKVAVWIGFEFGLVWFGIME